MIVPKAMKGREIEFSSLIALGMNPSDAYKRAFRAKRVTADVIAKRADRLCKEQRIIDRVAMCVAELKLEQIDSLGKAYRDLLDSLDKCLDAKNYAAYFSGMRLRLQCLGMLKDNINITSEQKMTDEQLLDRLGSKDPELKGKLRLVVGSGDAYST